VCGVCLLRTTPDPALAKILDAETARGFKLRPFQRDDVLWLSARRRALIANQMGTGKTIEACVGALRSDAVNLCFVPASMRLTWKREVEEWRPDMVASLVTTKRDWPRAWEASKPGRVLIASYAMLPGEPCGGCRSRGADLCVHDGPDRAHPEWTSTQSPERLVGREYKNHKRLPFRLPPGLTAEDPERRKRAQAVMEQILSGELPPIPSGSLAWQESPAPEVGDRFTVLVGDEIHAVKNPTTLRTKLWRGLAGRVSRAGGHVYGMSGTPIENHPQEYWEVLTGLGLERASFGDFRTFEALFGDWYANEKGMRRPPGGQDLQDVLRRLSRVRVHRRTRDVLQDLPPVQIQDIEVEITKARMADVNTAVQRMFATRRAWADVEKGELLNPYEPRLTDDERERRTIFYKQRLDLYFVQKPWDEDKEVVEAITEVLSPKSWSPGIDELARVRRLLSLAKIEAVEEWVTDCEAQDEPVVLFCQHVEMIKRFGARPGWVPFHGSMPSKARDDAMCAFQAGDVKHGIAVSIGAGREGITLTRARVAAFIDLNWNPARNRQAIARVCRIGSEHHRSILVVRFVAKHPVDKLVLRTLAEKEKLLDAMDAAQLFDPETGEAT
jgi:SNF2 family DNA or RNA helicase